MKSLAILRTRTLTQSQAMLMGATMVLAMIAQTLAANARPDSFADLAERLSPAVVNITTTTKVIQRNTPQQPIVPKGSPLEDLFRDFMNRNDNQGQRSRPRQQSALGSGFIISADGFIVTNNHVIDGADEIQIELFDDGRLLDAKLVGRDAKTDVALLKVEADAPLPFVTFGDSDIARVGDWVLAIGNPLGQGFSVSAGIISARNRSLRGTYDDFIQTDAAINRGNSGGPLFNMDGDVIGVNTAIISPSGGSIGLGFSMSSAVVSKVVDQLKEFGETRRGWLGVRIQDVDPALAEALGLEKVAGALVSDLPSGPALEAGIESGDVILSFDGTDIEDTRELVKLVGNTEVGKSVRVVVFRDGKTQTLKVVLARREEAEGAEVVPAVAAPVKPKELEELGMKLMTLTPDALAQMGLEDDVTGVVVMEVDETAEAFEKGIRAGDLITEAGQVPVANTSAIQDALKNAKEAGRKSLLLKVVRDGEPRFVGLNIE